MIVACDASFLIALRSGSDSHSDAARRILVGANELVVHPVTLAETLVAPARHGLARDVRLALTIGLGVRVWVPDEDEPERVANLRVRTNLKLPDCYVLDLAIRSSARLASFDAGLRAAAHRVGVLCTE